MTSNVKQEWYKELASLKEDDNDTTQLASQRDAAPVASAPLASFAFEDRHSPVKMEITDEGCDNDLGLYESACVFIFICNQQTIN